MGHITKLLIVLLALVGQQALAMGRRPDGPVKVESFKGDLLQNHAALTRQTFAGEVGSLMAEHRDILKDLYKAPFDQAQRDEIKTRYHQLRHRIHTLKNLNLAMVTLPHLSRSVGLKSGTRVRMVRAIRQMEEDLLLAMPPEALVKSLGGVYVVLDSDEPAFSKLLQTFPPGLHKEMANTLKTAREHYKAGRDLQGNTAMLGFLNLVGAQWDLLEGNLYRHIQEGRIKDAHRISMQGGLLYSLHARLSLPAMMVLQEMNHSNVLPLLAHNRHRLGLPEPGTQSPVVKTAALAITALALLVLVFMVRKKSPKTPLRLVPSPKKQAA